ncbi:MAG TPA: hypothetical protein DIS79_06055 [Bacteroidetes bacterium]|mgnify:CR=1 FL=1|nr:hypothetical protein [Bacteroidota bacterium]
MESMISEVLANSFHDTVVQADEILRNYGSDPVPAGVDKLRQIFPTISTSILVDCILGLRSAQRLGKYIDGWVFTKKSAEQSTHPLIAEHHARVLTGGTAGGHVLEICTGAGLDARALVLAGNSVTTYEADTILAAIAQGNMNRAGLSAHVVHSPWSPGEYNKDTYTAVWADPSRRDDRTRQRYRYGTDYEPQLQSVLQLSPLLPLGIKIGPADRITDEKSPGEGNSPGELNSLGEKNSPGELTSEWIGRRGECLERILWRNVRQRPGPSRISIIDGTTWYEREMTRPAQELNTIELRSGLWLIEPHPAVIAAGDVSGLFREVGANPFDTAIAYGLVERDPGPSKWYQRFFVDAVDRGVSERRIRERLIELGRSSHTEFKKRGWDRDPESLRRHMNFVENGTAGVVLIARHGTGHVTIHARRVEE